MTSIIDWPRHSRWTWIVAALLFLLLVLLWFAGHGPGSACCGAPGTTPPVAVAPPPPPTAIPAPAPAVPAPAAQGGVSDKLSGDLQYTVDADQLSLEGVVPDQATKERVLRAAIVRYGDGNVVDKIGIDASRSASRCADKADALFAEMKGGSRLKNGRVVGIDCTPAGVILVGSVFSESDEVAREQWAHDFFGADTNIINQLRVVAPEQAATPVAAPAPVARAEDVRCGDRIAAAVTFATGSARVDAAGRKLLDAIAPCLKDGSYEIGGHTDNVGGAEANMSLSNARAQAVRTYLVGAGAAGDRLVAVGYGAEHPIADNGTAEGRARNRRIEFAKK